MNELNQQVYQFFKILAKEYPQIQSILLYGSRARGDFGDKSDFDIAIIGEIDFSIELEILDKVDEWNFAYKVELVFFNKVSNQQFKENILKDGMVIVNKFQQKKENYAKALTRLQAALTTDLTDDIVIDATIQRFEFSVELAWKTLRAYLLEEGISKEEITSPKSVVRAGFQNNIIDNPDVWFAMLEARNITSHVYDLEEAQRIVDDIKNNFYSALEQLLKSVEK